MSHNPICLIKSGGGTGPVKPGNLRETAWCQIRRCESKDEGNPKLQSAPPCGALFSYLLPSCHSEPVRTLAWESASPGTRLKSNSLPKRTDCHTSDVGHSFAMTFSFFSASFFFCRSPWFIA